MDQWLSHKKIQVVAAQGIEGNENRAQDEKVETPRATTHQYLDRFDKMLLVYTTYLTVSLVGLVYSFVCVCSEKRREQAARSFMKKLKRHKKD